MNWLVKLIARRKIGTLLIGAGFPRKETRKMLKTLFKGGQWANLIVFLADLINKFTQAFPGIALPPWVTALQTALGIFLPSVGGIAHQLAFGVPQDPDAAKK